VDAEKANYDKVKAIHKTKTTKDQCTGKVDWGTLRWSDTGGCFVGGWHPMWRKRKWDTAQMAYAMAHNAEPVLRRAIANFRFRLTRERVKGPDSDVVKKQWKVKNWKCPTSKVTPENDRAWSPKGEGRRRRRCAVYTEQQYGGGIQSEVGAVCNCLKGQARPGKGAEKDAVNRAACATADASTVVNPTAESKELSLGDSGLADGQYAGQSKQTAVQKEIGSSSGSQGRRRKSQGKYKDLSLLISANGMSYARKATEELGDGGLDADAMVDSIKKSLGEAQAAMPFAHRSHHELGDTDGRRGGSAGIATDVSFGIGGGNRAGNSEEDEEDLEHL